MNKPHYERNFTQIQFREFLERLNGFSDCKFLSSKLDRDDGHYNSYKYTSSNGEFSLHHDTKGNILQVNAEGDTLENLLELARSVKKIAAEKTENLEAKQRKGFSESIIKIPVIVGKVDNQIKQKQILKSESKKVLQLAPIIKPAKQQENNIKKSVDGAASVSGKKAVVKNMPKGKNENKTSAAKSISTTKTTTKAVPIKQQQTAPIKAEPEYKDGYSLKNYPLERFNEALAALKRENGATVGKAESFNQGANNHLIRRVVKDAQNNKINIQYTVKSQTIQIQGKRSDLFTTAQIVITNEANDLNSAVKAYIDFSKNEQSASTEAVPEISTDTTTSAGTVIKVSEKIEKPMPDKTTKGVLKDLKNKIPDAFSYLSESEKAQLTFTMIDLDSKVRNYSGVLLPAYITLEQLISTLQKKESISVKMIGQAFEKEDDKYVLKSGYVKKIESVIYIEVVCALYNEYNKRHKYMHSDLDSGTMNIISDKATAKNIFDEMMRIINYNFKKLKEIKFTL